MPPLLGGGEKDGTKQPKGEIWISQHYGHGFTRPRKFINFRLAGNNRTLNSHLSKLNLDYCYYKY